MADALAAGVVLAVLAWLGFAVWEAKALGDERDKLRSDQARRLRETQIKAAVDAAADKLPEDDRGRLAKILNDGLP